MSSLDRKVEIMPIHPPILYYDAIYTNRSTPEASKYAHSHGLVCFLRNVPSIFIASSKTRRFLQQRRWPSFIQQRARTTHLRHISGTKGSALMVSQIEICIRAFRVVEQYEIKWLKSIRYIWHHLICSLNGVHEFRKDIENYSS